MKKIKMIISVLIAAVIVMSVFAGCSNEGGSVSKAEYHLNEDIKKYGDISPEAEKAILEFAEKYGDLSSKLDEKDNDTAYALADEFCGELSDLDSKYLSDIDNALRGKISGVTADEAATINKLRELTYFTTMGYLNAAVEYNKSGSEDDFKEVKKEAVALIDQFLDAFTAEGAPNK